MSLTRARIIQYVGILLALGLIAAGYWYFSARASTKVNKTATGSLTSDLVGYWTFDGADVVWSDTTSEVKDRSGNGNHGDIPTPANVTSVAGKIGQAIHFDGTAWELIYLNSWTNLEMGTGDMSVSVWLKTTEATDRIDLFSKGGEGTEGYVAYYAPATNELGASVDTGATNIYYSAEAPSLLNDGVWHMVGIVIDRDAGVSFYVDGTFIGRNNTSVHNGADITNVAADARIGAGGGTVAVSSLDELRLYNRVLAVSEVQGLYDMGKVKLNTRPGDDALEEGLAGYWKLDENTGTSAADATGNGSTGTLTNGPTWSTGKIGSAVTFDGTDDYIEMGNVTALNSLTRVTASAWVKTAIGTGEKHMFDKSACNGSVNTGVFELLSNYVGTGRPSFAIYKNGGTPEVYLADSTARIDDNTWHLVTGVYDGANAIIYVDGVNTGQTAAAGITLSSTTNTLQIGGNCNGTGAFEWNGSIDEVRAYTRALSPDEVALLYRETHPDDPDTNLVGHWTFDGVDVSGTTVLDRGRGGNRGTLTNGPTVTPGRLGQALNFDGTDDKVNCGDTTTLRNLEDQGGGGMTVMAWIKPRSAGGSGGKGHIVGKENNDSGPGDGQWALSLSGTSNRLTFGHSRATQPIAAYANNAWVTDTWQHVAVTFNGGTVASTAIHIYANGTELSHAYDQDGSGAYSTDATASLLIGGGYSAGNGWNFDGLIDDVRVYNRVLSATEIAELYKSFGGKTIVASSGNDTLRSGLVGQWSMDGQDVNWADTTTEVKDRSGNANHGNAINMSSASVTPGRIGQALQFDGVDDEVNFGDPVSGVLDFGTNDFTVSLWVKVPFTSSLQWASLIGKGFSTAAVANTWGVVQSGTSQTTLSYEDSLSNGSFNVDITTGSMSPGWRHVVVTRSGTTHKIFVDATEQDSGVATAANLTNADELGASKWGDGWFRGSLDDLRIYNKALTLAEIEGLYRMGR